MTKVIELLDAVKAAKNAQTDYALAKALELHRWLISDYYAGKRTPNEYACMQIAKAINMPLDLVTATIRMEAEKDEKRRNAWREYYKSIGGLAASIMIFVLASVTLIVTTTPPALAKSATYEYAFSNNTNYAYYRRRIRTLISVARHKLSTLFPRVGLSC